MDAYSPKTTADIKLVASKPRAALVSDWGILRGELPAEVRARLDFKKDQRRAVKADVPG